MIPALNQSKHLRIFTGAVALTTSIVFLIIPALVQPAQAVDTIPESVWRTYAAAIQLEAR